MHAIKRLSLSKWPTTATTGTIPNAQWLERGWLFFIFQNIFNYYIPQNGPLQQTPPLFPMHRGWKGPFNTFSKNIFSKRVSMDQNWPNDQILCMDHYVG